MTGILDLLNSDLGKTLIEGTSKQLRQDKGKTVSALNAALPFILGAMKNNAGTQNGASGLLGALRNERHNGGILDNIGSILGGSNIDTAILQDGAGILKHVFGGKEQNVAHAVSRKSGMDSGSAMNILKVAAPIIMGYLGKQTRQKKVIDNNGIGNLLGGLLGGGAKNEQALVTQILDADGDGSVIDDIIGMGSGGKKKDGPGGLFGGR